MYSHAIQFPEVGIHYFKDLAAPQLYLNDNPFDMGRNIILDPVAVPAPLDNSYVDSGKNYYIDSPDITYTLGP